jgi:hypothetical protein
MGRTVPVNQLQDLVRSEGEPRWAAVVDAGLAVAVVAWVLLLGVAHPGATLKVVVPLVLAAVVVARVVVLVEHVQRWRELGLADAPPPQAPLTQQDHAVRAA